MTSLHPPLQSMELGSGNLAQASFIRSVWLIEYVKKDSEQLSIIVFCRFSSKIMRSLVHLSSELTATRQTVVVSVVFALALVEQMQSTSWPVFLGN